MAGDFAPERFKETEFFMSFGSITQTEKTKKKKKGQI